ncbi:MAG TPA: DUF420 domain-containing protein, partial [Bacteroidia bacterium]|nr:DUF420 domain-containing protein [Bacteroidia bacterium]
MSDLLSKMQEKTVFRIVLSLSIVVFLVVIILDSKILPRPEVMPAFGHYLPLLNAIINGTCTILLLLSFNAIKKRDIAKHKSINLITFFLSAIFLVSYVTYHWMS